MALQTLYMILDTLATTPLTPGAGITGNVPELLELFRKTLGDHDSMGVRVWTIRSLGKLSEYIEVGEDAEIVSSWVYFQRRSIAAHVVRRCAGCFPISTPFHHSRH